MHHGKCDFFYNSKYLLLYCKIILDIIYKLNEIGVAIMVEEKIIHYEIFEDMKMWYLLYYSVSFLYLFIIVTEFLIV